MSLANVNGTTGCRVTPCPPNSVTITPDVAPKLKGVGVDYGKFPDATMTLAVVALFAEGPTTICNV
jgi:5-enolpyruvylshikimate-3-phosphate synthase